MRNFRLYSAAFVLIGLVTSHATLTAQDLKVVVDRDNGELSLTGVSATIVDLGGYVLQSASAPGTFVGGNFNGLSDEPVFGDQWDIAVASSAVLSELNGDGTSFTSINDTLSYSLGVGAYNPAAAIQAAGFGVDVEVGDLSLIYADVVLDESRDGVIEYTGEKIFNNIGITVDLSDGSAIIENESPFNQVITGYLIEADTPGTLNTTDTFTGLGGNFQAPTAPDGENLGELDPTGTGVALNAGASLSLGIVGGTLDDLTMSFILAGVGEVSRPGFVKYLDMSFLEADFDRDGDVDGDDFLRWQGGFGTPSGAEKMDGDYDNDGDVDGDDFLGWQAEFGSGGGGSGAVPEPASGVIALLVTLMGICLWRR